MNAFCLALWWFWSLSTVVPIILSPGNNENCFIWKLIKSCKISNIYCNCMVSINLWSFWHFGKRKVARSNCAFIYTWAWKIFLNAKFKRFVKIVFVYMHKRVNPSKVYVNVQLVENVYPFTAIVYRCQLATHDHPIKCAFAKRRGEEFVHIWTT